VIRIFDRYLIQIFIRSFLICFISMVGLYIVIDAFSNLDEFSERSHGVSLLTTMGGYYAYRVSLFFDQLAGVITTISAMFTFSWIQRTNELMPLLAAGVPVRRVVAPVFIAAMVISGLAIVNQEMVIPRIAAELVKRPDDDSVRTVKGHYAHDPRGILFNGDECNRQEQKVLPAFVTLQPKKLVGSLLDLRAREAEYVAPGQGEPSGGWILRDVTPAKFQCSEKVLQPLDAGNYFLHTTITFDHLLRKQAWFQFSSTRELIDELRRGHDAPPAEMAVLLHTRLTRPLATLTLLFLCLPFVLSGTDRRMVSLVGLSLVVSLAFQMFSQLCHRMGDLEFVGPPLAAWLPVLVFGTLAVGLYDLVKT
jgi:lipopolysaccharide export system permease protein